MFRGSMGGVEGWGLGAVGLVVVVTAACGGGGAATPAELATGGELFRATCASCHGRDGEGMPKLGKDLRRNEFVDALDDEELFQFFKIGRPADHPLNQQRVDMPPKGGNPGLQDEDLRLIAAYVRSIQ